MSKRIPRLAKISTLYRDWLRSLVKMVNYLSCIEGKGGGKYIHYSAQMPHYLLI